MTYTLHDQEVRLRFDVTVVEDWDILDTSSQYMYTDPITKVINMDVNLWELGWGNRSASKKGSVAHVMEFINERVIGKTIPDRHGFVPEGPGQDPVALNLIEEIRLEANEIYGFAANYEVPGHPMRRYIKDIHVFQVGGPMTKEWRERNKVDGIKYEDLMNRQFPAGKRPWDEDWYDYPDGDTNPNPHRGKTGDLQ